MHAPKCTYTNRQKEIFTCMHVHTHTHTHSHGGRHGEAVVFVSQIAFANSHKALKCSFFLFSSLLFSSLLNVIIMGPSRKAATVFFFHIILMQNVMGSKNCKYNFWSYLGNRMD